METKGLGLEITELRLGLPGGGNNEKKRDEKKRVFSEVSGEDNSSKCNRKEPAKSQVVGWPPVCSYRRKNSCNEKAYVKVSINGAPFLRKLDLGFLKDYSQLVLALDNLFSCYGAGKVSKDADNSDYVPIYEDKDGDWMLLGDVPWEMFIESCKRLRIMKRSEATGFGLQHKEKENRA